MADRDPDDPDTLTPGSLIRQYPPLGDAIGPLRTLAEVNPGLLDDILALAMVMGIHAAESKQRHDRLVQQLSEDMDRGLRFFDSPTYGDLQSPPARTLRPGWHDKPQP